MNKRKIFYVIVGLLVVFIAVQTIIDISKEKDKGTENSSYNIENNSTSENLTDETQKVPSERILAKIEELRQNYPDGMFWNHMDMDEDEYEEGKSYITAIPCNHDKNNTKYCNVYKGKSNDAYPYAVAGRQSVGFASLLSDYVFGKEAEAYSFTEYDKVRIGDQARIDNDTQTVFIIGKTDEYIEVVEVNSAGTSCQISWGRQISRSDLTDAFYISRY